MQVGQYESDPGSRELLAAAFLAGVVIAVAVAAPPWGRLILETGPVAAAGEAVPVLLVGVALGTVGQVPLLLAVLLVVAGPSRRTVAGGAALVYASQLLLAAGWTLRGEVGRDIELPMLAVPLAPVATFLGVATAVWLARHGGYERLRSALGNPAPHPLFAPLADRDAGPDLPLQRALVAAGLAAVVAAGALVVAGGVADLLRTVARSGTGGAQRVVVVVRAEAWSVGIPPSRFPTQWLFEASFLLAVLFVTGARLGPRELLKGVAVIVAVQSTVALLPALVPPFRPVDLWAEGGPVLAPLSDAVLFLGIGVAVWLAFHGGLETLRELGRSSLASG